MAGTLHGAALVADFCQRHDAARARVARLRDADPAELARAQVELERYDEVARLWDGALRAPSCGVTL